MNDTYTQFGYIDGFETTTKILTMEDIKIIFEKMLREHEASVVQLISGNNSLTNQRLDSLSKDINELKESLEFSQNEYDDKFKNIGDKVQKLEEEINLMKEELHVIQATKLSWVMETDAKLVDLKDRSRQGIKE